MLHKTLLLVVVRAIQQIILIGRVRGCLVKKRHSYRCNRGSDYKPVAVARYINLVREPWSSLSLSLSLSFSWQAEVASAFILPLPETRVGMRGLQEARVRFLAAARACFYKRTPLPFFFSLSLSPFLSPSTGTIYKGEMNVVTSLLETIREHDLSRHVGSE